MKTINIILLLLIVGLVVVGTIFVAEKYGEKKEQSTTIQDSTIKKQLASHSQLEFNNVRLDDHTYYDSVNNICYASNLGMNITVSPCLANDPDGKEIRQDVKFKWTGATTRNISWIFVYEDELKDGKIFAYLPREHTAQRPISVWVNNYLVDRIVSYTNLTSTPSYCNLGNLNNTQFYNVMRTTVNGSTYNQTICFTTRTVVNATAFRISGNTDGSQDYTYTSKDKIDVTDQVEFLGKGLLNDNRSYYKVSSVSFSPNEVIETEWVFTPKNNNKMGKWHILGFDTNTGLIQSVVNKQYVYQDPWWSASFLKKKVLYIQETSGQNLFNFTANFTVTYDSDMQTDFDDLRFVDSTESVEYPYWIESKTDSTSAHVYVRIKDVNMTASANTTVYMYYGNAGASSSSNKNSTFLFNDDFGGAGVDSSKWLSQTEGGSVSLFNNKLYITSTATSKDIGIIAKNYNITRPIKMSFNFTGITIADSMRFRWGLCEYNSADCISYANRENYGTTAAWGIFTTANNMMWEHSTYTNAPLATSIPVNVNQKLSYVQVSPTNRSYYINGTLQKMTTTNYATMTPAIYCMNVGACNISIADFRLQSYAAIEPLYTFGAEESSSGITTSLSVPADNYITNLSDVLFNFTVQPVSLNITNYTFYTWYSTGTVRHQHFNDTRSLRLNSTTVFQHNDTALSADVVYTWNVEACGRSDTDGSTVCDIADSNRTLTRDSIAPTLTLRNLTNTTIFSLPGFITVNMTSSDDHLDTCFYTTSDSPATKTDYACNVSQTLTFVTGGQKNITIYANDTAGNHNSTTVTAYVLLFNVSQSGSATASEGTETTFTLFINSTGYPLGSSDADLWYNNANQGYTTKTTLDANSVIFTKVLSVNSGTGNSSGRPLTWFWNYNTAQLSSTNTANQTQTVYSISIDNCSTNSVNIINYTLKDEDTKAFLAVGNATNSTIEIAVTLTSWVNTSNVWNYSTSQTNKNPILICVNEGSINGNSTYRLDAQAKYSSTDRVQEYYNTQYHNLTNTSARLDIALYDLQTTDSDECMINVKDYNLLPYTNAVIDIQRKYVSENKYISVESPITDSLGNAIGHFVVSDELYNIIIKRNGVVTQTYSNVYAQLNDGVCLFNLRTTLGNYPMAEYETFRGVNYYKTYNKTSDIYNLSYTSVDGTSKTVNLIVKRFNPASNITLCSYNVSGTTGTLGCIFSSSVNDTIAVTAYVNNQLLYLEYIQPDENKGSVLGEDRFLIAAILIVLLTLVGISSPSFALLFYFLGMVASSAFYLIRDDGLFGWGAIIGWFAIAGAVILYKIAKGGKD